MTLIPAEKPWLSRWISPGNRLVYSSGGALGYGTLRMLAIDPAHPEPARNRLVYAREQADTNIWRLPGIYFVSTRSGRPEAWQIPSGRRWLYYAKDMARPTSRHARPRCSTPSTGRSGSASRWRPTSARSYSRRSTAMAAS